MPKIGLSSVYEFLFGKSQNEDLLVYPNLPLLDSVFSVLLFDLIYLGFVLKLGPRLMKGRQAFQLKNVLMVYNATQVIACSFTVIVGIYYFAFTDLFDFGCVRKLPPNHPTKPIEVSVIYVAYLTKYLDYLDTVFFVLRKSYRQLTFLHVYHHLIVSFATYWYVRDYGFGGHGMVAGFFNAVVHVFMYSYYFAAANKPELKKSVWWKRYITELQIVQFVIILVHQMWPIFVRTDCDYPKRWLCLVGAQSIMFLYLFGKFYRNTYLRKTTTAAKLENGYVKTTELTKKVI